MLTPANLREAKANNKQDGTTAVDAIKEKANDYVKQINSLIKQDPLAQSWEVQMDGSSNLRSEDYRAALQAVAHFDIRDGFRAIIEPGRVSRIKVSPEGSDTRARMAAPGADTNMEFTELCFSVDTEQLKSSPIDFNSTGLDGKNAKDEIRQLAQTFTDKLNDMINKKPTSQSWEFQIDGDSTFDSPDYRAAAQVVAAFDVTNEYEAVIANDRTLIIRVVPAGGDITGRS